MEKTTRLVKGRGCRLLVLGFILCAAIRLAADQNNSAIEGAAACVGETVPVTTPPNPAATVVMCGLDNPRGLAFHQSALYVAEAGKGGFGLIAPPCFMGQAGGTRCYGPTGAISRLWNSIQTRVAAGLPSHANLQGRQAIGPNDIALIAGADGTAGLQQQPAPRECDPVCAYVTIGLQQPPDFREPDRYPFLADFARLARLLATGEWSYVADFGTYETEHDPDHAFYEPDKLDTNPYGLIAAPSGRAAVLVDAGGNSALHVDAAGEISTLAAFAPHPDDSVPTSIDVGPDGAYYVGELTGFPLVSGAANIYRLGRGRAPEICLTDFTSIIDIAFDNRGTLYVLEFAGTLIRVTPNRSAAADRDDRSVMCAQYEAGERTTVVRGLLQPTSVAIGPDGAVYVTNRAIFPGTGHVIRYELDAK